MSAGTMPNASPGLLPSELINFVSSPATEPFWAAAREHRLVVPRCTACGTYRFPPAAFCCRGLCRATASLLGRPECADDAEEF